jgi:hypothetical protein
VNTCDKCEHFRVDSTGRLGACEKASDYNAFHKDDPMPDDCMAGWDYECYKAGVVVGPKFGCIHWEEKR